MTNSSEELLIEKLGVFFEKSYELSPVSARILSKIVLSGKQGVTFDQLVQQLCASKSTISTQLNLLQDLNKIEYYTKPGDRKKYFITHKNMLLNQIDSMLLNFNQEKELHAEIKIYKEEKNQKIPDSSLKFNLKLHDDYIFFIEETTKLINQLKKKIQEN